MSNLEHCRRKSATASRGSTLWSLMMPRKTLVVKNQGEESNLQRGNPGFLVPQTQHGRKCHNGLQGELPRGVSKDEMNSRPRSRGYGKEFASLLVSPPVYQQQAPAGG